jgi:mono/diheme cytochrome c family protein
MRDKRFFTVLLAVLSGIGLLLVLGMAFQANPKGEAETTFEAKCAACHGKDLKADSRIAKMVGVPDLMIRSNWKHGTSEADVEKVIRDGPGRKMPPFKDKLTEQEIKALAEYVRHLAGVDKPETQVDKPQAQ